MSETNKPATMLEEYEPEQAAKLRWTEAVDGPICELFSALKLEKLTAEDGNGNKVKLSLTRDNEIKIELSSITIR